MKYKYKVVEVKALQITDDLTIKKLFDFIGNYTLYISQTKRSDSALSTIIGDWVVIKPDNTLGTYTDEEFHKEFEK